MDNIRDLFSPNRHSGKPISPSELRNLFSRKQQGRPITAQELKELFSKLTDKEESELESDPKDKSN